MGVVIRVVMGVVIGVVMGVMWIQIKIIIIMGYTNYKTMC